MDRAYFVTNLGNNFPEAYFFHMKNSAQKNQSGEKKKKHQSGQKKTKHILFKKLSNRSRPGWLVRVENSWMNHALRRFGCKPMWELCELCNVSKCIKCDPVRPSNAWKLSYAASLSLQIMMARGFMFDASVDSGCSVDVCLWMKPLRLKDLFVSCCKVADLKKITSV